MYQTPDPFPILLDDPEAYLAQVAEDLHAPLDGLSFSGLSYLSRYSPDLLRPPPLHRRLEAALRRHAPPHADTAVEFGSGIGAFLRHLAPYARRTFGFDINLAALRAARAHLDGHPLPHLQRLEGRHFRTRPPIHLPPLPSAHPVHLAIANAMRPPLQDQSVDIVCALNLLDNVNGPWLLLQGLHRILRPGGLLILTSPFSWSDTITPPAEALGGGLIPGWVSLGTARGLRALYRGELPFAPDWRYRILERFDIPWRLREDARRLIQYRVHALVLRREPTP